jgi:hypothetical protein
MARSLAATPAASVLNSQAPVKAAPPSSAAAVAWSNQHSLEVPPEVFGEELKYGKEI